MIYHVINQEILLDKNICLGKKISENPIQLECSKMTLKEFWDSDLNDIYIMEVSKSVQETSFRFITKEENDFYYYLRDRHNPTISAFKSFDQKIGYEKEIGKVEFDTIKRIDWVSKFIGYTGLINTVHYSNITKKWKPQNKKKFWLSNNRKMTNDEFDWILDKGWNINNLYELENFVKSDDYFEFVLTWM